MRCRRKCQQHTVAVAVIAAGNLVAQNVLDIIAVDIEIVVEIMLQHGREDVELCGNRVGHISLVFGCRAEIVKRRFALAVILEARRIYE